MTTENAIFVFDFTLGAEFCIDHGDLKNWLVSLCKKWCFQKEKGEDTGYIHFQGRLSLKAKNRLQTLKNKCPWKEIHLSPTSKDNQSNMFYVTKEETRIEGPWADTDAGQTYIPRHLRNITKLLPWQESVVTIASKELDTRTVHCIVNETGNLGKSTLVSYLGVKGLATEIPFCNDFKDIMRMVMDQPKVGCYLIDMPKAIGKDKLRQLYAGIEKIKDGYAYDDRYSFRKEYFDIPNVFVFTNIYPDLSLLSADRWVIWTIDDKLELVRYHNNHQTVVPSVMMNLGAQTAITVEPKSYLLNVGKSHWDESNKVLSLQSNNVKGH